MEIDYKTVKALSSPTRIKILNQVMAKDATTTDISREIGKTKSTVSTHLATLVDAGLIEKDEVEGRKRVIYRPTRHAKDIIRGKERRVKFSISSSIITALGATIFMGKYIQDSFMLASPNGDQVTMMSQELSADAARNSAEMAAQSPGIQFSPEIFLSLSVGMFLLALIGFTYGVVMNSLQDNEERV